MREAEFEQFLFFEQWAALRAAARERGIRIMGDVPIFVAHDSADVWAHPELFQLGRDGGATRRAGVPPDYFSATGQLWGNPLYRWDALARDRLRLVDRAHARHLRARGPRPARSLPRLRGLLGGAGRRRDGRARALGEGPGAALFEAVRAALGELPIVAEDLGVITPEVEALRDGLGLPGMAILQFAFGGDAHANDFLPHNYPKRKVVYTGTHDNDTTVGWWSAGVGNSTRTPAEVERERERALAYLGGDGSEIHWDFIRTLLVSVADTAIVPLQDVLGLGSEARMNLPGRADGNWGWRYASADLTAALRKRLRAITDGSGRTPRTGIKAT